VYNEGVTAFQGSTLRRLIHNNPNDPAITDAFKMWDKERKDGQLVFSQGIYDRRVRDAALYFS